MNKKRFLSLILIAMLTAQTLVSCGSGKTGGGDTSAADPTGTTSGAEVNEAPDPFADFDFGGEEIRIYTSINEASGIGNSNYLIEGPEEETGDLVSDSAYLRNRNVEEILNVNLVFTQLDNNYQECAGTINRLILSGDDLYDIIINDLFPMAGLALQGAFLNVADAPYIDTAQPYWYENYMSQLSLDGGDHQYILAGDFFIDILRSAHALYFNKSLLTDMFGDGDLLYNEVLDGTWTYDKFLTYIENGYRDLNGDSQHDKDDQYGFAVMQVWGPSIPFITSADLTYVTPDGNGGLKLAMNNERSIELLEKLNKIFYSEGTGIGSDVSDSLFAGSNTVDADTTNLFKSGRALFLGYNRLGSFDNMRDMEDEVGILPYPKFDENQEYYISSSHDTTEIGVIPITNTRFDMTCAVLEVLNRETQKIVLPAYYETGLKVKYTRDDLSSQMIDIIHNNIGGSFALAYSNSCANIFMFESFYAPLIAKSSDFVSNYAKKEQAAQTKLDSIVESFRSIDQ